MCEPGQLTWLEGKVTIRPGFSGTVPIFNGLSRENWDLSRDAYIIVPIYLSCPGFNCPACAIYHTIKPIFSKFWSRRARLPSLLYPTVRSRYRERRIAERMNPFRRLIASKPVSSIVNVISRCQLVRRVMFSRRYAQCLVCGIRPADDGSKRCFAHRRSPIPLRVFTCVDEGCCAVYCQECFDDLDRTCPLCRRQWPQRDHHDVDCSQFAPLPVASTTNSLQRVGGRCSRDDLVGEEDEHYVIDSVAVREDDTMSCCKSGGKVSV